MSIINLYLRVELRYIVTGSWDNPADTNEKRGVQRADRDTGLGWASRNPLNSKTATIVKNTVH